MVNMNITDKPYPKEYSIRINIIYEELFVALVQVLKYHVVHRRGGCKS